MASQQILYQLRTGIPSDLSASGHFKYIALEWTNPADADLAFVEVYENTSNSTSGGTLVGTTRGNTFSRSNLGLNQLRYYYVQAVDNTGNVSGFSSVVNATTTFLDDPDFANGIYSLFTDQGLYAIEDVNGLPASGTFTGEKVFNRNDGKLYQWTGSAWEQVVGGAEDFSDLAGSIAGAQIPNGLIDTLKLADDAVSNAKIDVDAVQGDVIAAGAITSTKIADDAVNNAKIAVDAVQGDVIAAGAITNTKIASLAVNASKIASDAITTDKIASGAVTAGEIASNAVTDIKIATDAITETKIASNAITTAKIAAGAITAGEIAAGAVVAGKIASGAIDAS